MVPFRKVCAVVATDDTKVERKHVAGPLNFVVIAAEAKMIADPLAETTRLCVELYSATHMCTQ